MSRHNQKIKDIIFHKGYNKVENKKVLDKIASFIDEEIVAIYNPECIGIMNSTKDMFTANVGIKEIFSEKFLDEIVDAIILARIKCIVFSSITFGWKNLAERLHEKAPQIKIKFFWHGAHAMLVQKDEAYFLYSIMELLDRNIACSIAFAKESMADFYKMQGYNAFFLPNNVKNISAGKDAISLAENKNGKINIGLYSAGNRWEKNTFNQLSAISMIKNSVVDIVPINELTENFCKLMNIRVKDKTLKYMPRQKLFERMALNDVNLYVTFTECSPVIPLESLQLGVPCITGNNHHYFRNSKLYDYLVVKSEDDIDEIKSKVEIALKNKEEIMKLYKEWKKEYDIFVNEKFQEFVMS